MPRKPKRGAASPPDVTRGGARPARRLSRRRDVTLELEAVGDVAAGLDPRLQDRVRRVRRRSGPAPGAAVGADAAGPTEAVEVIVVVRDPNVAVPGLVVRGFAGDVGTGTVAEDAIERVRTHPNVVSLKASRPVRSTSLTGSTREIRGDASALAGVLDGAGRPLDGRGVVVGVVDFGCDVAHRNFRTASGATRLTKLWVQAGTGGGGAPAGFGYGREYLPPELDAALGLAHGDDGGAVYARLAYAPEPEAHGTHVLDIAVGNGGATGAKGVAPAAEIVFVDLDLDLDEISGERDIGSSARLLDAVRYVFDHAAAVGKPAVVNLSLGTHGGPHDGSAPLDRGLENLLAVPGRAIVVAAGNSYADRAHAAGTLPPGASRRFAYWISSLDATPNEVEVWYPGRCAVDAYLVTPAGVRVGPIPPGRTGILRDAATQVEFGRVVHRADDPNNHDNVIDILLDVNAAPSWWRVELRNVGTDVCPFHAWIERDDHGPSYLALSDAVTSSTLGSLACGKSTIAVGSYVAADAQVSVFSAAGPTRDGREKPEISAPGDHIVAAAARSQGTTDMSGTSMAAPHLTGAVALMFQARPTLTAAAIRGHLLAAARRSPPAVVPDSRYGGGRVDVRGAIVGAAADPAEATPGPRPVADAARPGYEALAAVIRQMLEPAAGQTRRLRVEIEVGSSR